MRTTERALLKHLEHTQETKAAVRVCGHRREAIACAPREESAQTRGTGLELGSRSSSVLSLAKPGHFRQGLTSSADQDPPLPNKKG